MPLIYVKTKEGRIARTAPRGEYIPTDRYIAVRDTPYIRRLLNVHGDIELEPAKVKPAKADTAPPPPEAVAKPKAD